MTAPGPNINGEVPTVLVKDKNGRDLLCFLEQLIPLDDKDYALLSQHRINIVLNLLHLSLQFLKQLILFIDLFRQVLIYFTQL